MKKLIFTCLTCLLVISLFTGCAAGRKNFNELKGLILLGNLQMEKNKAFYSKHSVKARNDAFKRYRKNNRSLSARRK